MTFALARSRQGPFQKALFKTNVFTSILSTEYWYTHWFRTTQTNTWLMPSINGKGMEENTKTGKGLSEADRRPLSRRAMIISLMIIASGILTSGYLAAKEFWTFQSAPMHKKAD